jgi:hypothetical protein
VVNEHPAYHMPHISWAQQPHHLQGHGKYSFSIAINTLKPFSLIKKFMLAFWNFNV